MQKNLPLSDAYFRIFIRFFIDFVALVHFLAQGKVDFAMAVSKAHFHFFQMIFTNGKKRTKQQIAYHKHTGHYASSIVYAYFIKKIRFFSGLGI